MAPHPASPSSPFSRHPRRFPSPPLSFFPSAASVISFWCILLLLLSAAPGSGQGARLGSEDGTSRRSAPAAASAESFFGRGEDLSGLRDEAFRNRMLKQIPLIQGGSDAVKGRFPYVVMLLDRNDNLQCAGVLIDPSWVLTVAHCLDQSGSFDDNPLGLNPQLKIGAFEVGDVGGDGIVEATVGRAFLHPNWNGIFEDGHDIALLKLPSPSKISPVILAAKGTSFLDQDPMVAMGWGRQGQGEGTSDVLKWGELTYRSNENCNAEDWWNGTIVDEMMCAGGAGQDVCKGDSGGPLIQAHTPGGSLQDGNPAIDLLVGLVSFRNKPCDQELDKTQFRKPAVFTRVSEYADWIEDMISSPEISPPPERSPTLESSPPPEISPVPESLPSDLIDPVSPSPISFTPSPSPAKSSLEKKTKKEKKKKKQQEKKKKKEEEQEEEDEEKKKRNRKKDVKVEEKKKKKMKKDAKKSSCDADEDSDVLDSMLNEAARKGKLEDVKQLVACGADADRVQSRFGWNALMLASISGHTEVVKFLVNAGADLDIQTGSGNTALMSAASGGHSEIVRILVNAGANVKLRNGAGQRAQDMICESLEATCSKKTIQKMKKWLK